MSAVEVNKVNPSSGTNLQLGDSGDTITIPAGATFDSSAATNTLPANVVTTDGTQTLTNKSIVATQLTGTITPSDNTVSIAKLTATGTKDATTFLRGDNTFAEAGGGKVLQVVQTTLTTLLSTTSASFVEASGFNVAITPSSTSSKILVMVTTNTQNSAGNAGKTNVTLARGASVLQANGFAFHSQQSGATYWFSSSSAFNYLDSPNTTSATTYKVYFLGEVGTANINYNNSVGTITAIEVGA
tara:strand:- start:251 stop:979 length:729 start_codon:yes stop_codon:yes gene_type:complete